MRAVSTDHALRRIDTAVLRELYCILWYIFFYFDFFFAANLINIITTCTKYVRPRTEGTETCQIYSRRHGLMRTVEQYLLGCGIWLGGEVDVRVGCSLMMLVWDILWRRWKTSRVFVILIGELWWVTRWGCLLWAVCRAKMDGQKDYNRRDYGNCGWTSFKNLHD